MVSRSHCLTLVQKGARTREQRIYVSCTRADGPWLIDNEVFVGRLKPRSVNCLQNLIQDEIGCTTQSDHAAREESNDDAHQYWRRD